MQRLTFKDGRGRNALLLNGQEYHGPIADRLAAYEESGLEPEEVRGIKTAYDEVQIPYEVVATGADAARVIRLLDAEDEGRLIVLPCKVGTKVYDIISGKIKEKYYNLHSYRDKDLGRVIFLTREEAEAALEAQKGVAYV